MFALFLIYWLLPNRKVDARRVAPVAIIVGLVMELLKYVNLLLWPWLSAKLNKEYSVFQHSVTILIWSFVVAMVVLIVIIVLWAVRHDIAGRRAWRARREGAWQAEARDDRDEP